MINYCVKSSATLAIALAAVLGANSPASAGMIAYEGFDYAPDSGLWDGSGGLGQNGGYGWGASWTLTSGGTEFGTNIAGSMSYTGVSTSGNKELFWSGTGGTVNPQRMLSDTLGSYGSTIWMGLLWQDLTDSTGGLSGYRETKLALFTGATESGGVSLRNGGETVDIGIPHTYNAGIVDEYSIYGGGGSQLPTGVATLRGTDPANTVFLLARFDLDGTSANDTLSLWVNPDVAAGEGSLGAAMATYNNGDLDGINAIRMQLGSLNGSGTNGQVYIDELRLGTTFANAVTGVPEPAITSLVAVASGLMLLGLKRKRQ